MRHPYKTKTLPLRPPEVVMQLDRLGAFHQTRISFVRSLIRKMMREQWQIERSRFDLDADGFGTCIYSIKPPGEQKYSLVIFAQYLDDAERTDRVIAEKWDLACALCEGEPTEARLAELRANVPKQEAGRNQTDVLVLSRANKSTRNFDYFVDCLSRGEQPDPEVLAKVGYLYRTTAVYGNGKFGVADYDKLRQRDAFAGTFSAQMLTVYLLRDFSLRQVEHIARQRAPDTAVTLHEEIQRYMGIGNATGLGMAPFLIKHPQLIHAWVAARETALARVLHTGEATPAHLTRLIALSERAIIHFGEISTDNPRQQRYNALVQEETRHFRDWVAEILHGGDIPSDMWSQAVTWAYENSSLETQELITSLLLELYPDLVNDLDTETAALEQYTLYPAMTVRELKTEIESRYQWALAINFEAATAQHYFWYRSAEKEEPRLGERFNEPGAEKEMQIAIGRMVQTLHGKLNALPTDALSQTVVHFLLKHPQYKGIVRRVQSLRGEAYAEIQSNLLGAACLPIHLLRCKLSFFGASKFDPKSDLWVRITLFQGAPLLSEIGEPFADDWNFPCKPTLE